MTPEAINAFRDVAIDLIKIVGPALITGYVGYLTGKRQLDIKLREIDKIQEFKARKVLFDYYKGLADHLAAGFNSFEEAVGKILGAMSILEDDETTDTIIDVLESYTKHFPPYFENVKRSMEKEKLSDEEMYKQLIKYEKDVQTISFKGDKENIKQNILRAKEIYHILLICHNMVIQNIGEKILKPYATLDE